MAGDMIQEERTPALNSDNLGMIAMAYIANGERQL